VEAQLLGRTNKAYPPVWLSLSVPKNSDEIPSFIDAALEAKTVLEVSSQPALWGNRLRHENAELIISGGQDLEVATDEKHAADLTQAHLLQLLSSLGHEGIEFYFLKVKRALEEFQIAGAFAALEAARQEGHIAHLGLWVAGPALAVLPVWQFHDAFEVVLLNNEARTTLATLATERRVGVVVHGDDRPTGATWLAPVNSAKEIREAVSVQVATP